MVKFSSNQNSTLASILSLNKPTKPDDRFEEKVTQEAS